MTVKKMIKQIKGLEKEIRESVGVNCDGTFNLYIDELRKQLFKLEDDLHKIIVDR